MRTKCTGWTALAAAIMTAGSTTVRAEAADAPRATSTARRIVVSIPDRKLAVIDADDVTVFSVAVGAPATPSPTGNFTIVNRIPNPTYYKPGKVIGPGAANPL